MDIIHYLINLVQALFEQNQYLINFISKYLPLKQLLHDDSKSPKYQLFKVDELPVIKQKFKQDWSFLQQYYKWKYGKEVNPISRRSAGIPEGTICPICGAPEIYIYDNNGKGQYLCKVCGNLFTSSDDPHTKIGFFCPHCGKALVAKKNRSFFVSTNASIQNAHTI